MRIPLFATSLEGWQEQIQERLAEVVASGRFILGPEVEAFEAELAEYVGARHAIGVGNGTDALTIALRALGVGDGDEVICPSFTFYATAEAIVNAGGAPVFCDVDPATYCVTAETVRPHLTPRTKAIVPVHLFGNVAPIPELRELGVAVLEDAAQAIGARLEGVRAGALGDAATFSFFPSKNLPCLGDGGAITTSSDEVADLARRLRFHGSRDKQTFFDVGYNSRLDAIQAAVLRLLLPALDGWNERRRAVAEAYSESALRDELSLPAPGRGVEHVYHLYVATDERADEVIARLGEAGVQARGNYRTPLHRQPAMTRYATADLPVTDKLARTNLALPMGPELTREQIGVVVDACVRTVAR